MQVTVLPPTPDAVPIHPAFASRKPSPEGLDKIAKLRQAFSELYAVITECAPHSRERSVAITALEDCSMWSTRAVVCNDPGSEVQL